MAFTADLTDRDLTISPDGRRIYFGSDRPREEGAPRLDRLDVVYTERTPDGHWSDPVNVGPAVNTDAGARRTSTG